MKFVHVLLGTLAILFGCTWLAIAAKAGPQQSQAAAHLLPNNQGGSAFCDFAVTNQATSAYVGRIYCDGGGTGPFAPTFGQLWIDGGTPGEVSLAGGPHAPTFGQVGGAEVSYVLARGSGAGISQTEWPDGGGAGIGFFVDSSGPYLGTNTADDLHIYTGGGNSQFAFTQTGNAYNDGAYFTDGGGYCFRDHTCQTTAAVAAAQLWVDAGSSAAITNVNGANPVWIGATSAAVAGTILGIVKSTGAFLGLSDGSGNTFAITSNSTGLRIDSNQDGPISLRANGSNGLQVNSTDVRVVNEVIDPDNGVSPGTAVKTCTNFTQDTTHVRQGTVITVNAAGGAATKLCVCTIAADGSTPLWCSEQYVTGGTITCIGGTSTACP